MPDLHPLAASVGELLQQRGDTISLTESSCGGLISAALVAVPGASAYFRGSAVAYTRVAHKALLGVPDSAMENIRASSEPYAQLNANAVRESVDTTWALSETGASGPTGNRYGDSAGHACFAVSGPVERSMTVETGSADREANMWSFAQSALELLEQCIKEAP
ncbi:MAG: damage-inducible protein [SAR202 cluster bacterium Io17-Chloro-G9]|nr:MAG: damage-inducible protein [SAR202 cluster bacterium Io17-Chloro-G9]